jgi:hypothetical protein
MLFYDQWVASWAENIEENLNIVPEIVWDDFYLNPRRLRGSDFLMRWSQGLWSEERIVQAVNATGKFFALPYGPSSVAPENNPRAFEHYFDRLEKAGLGRVKRPDVLIYDQELRPEIEANILHLGGVTELPFTPESDGRMQTILSYAIIAVECENSLWRAKKMPDFNKSLKSQKRLNGAIGLPKNAVLPTVILKEEDRLPLRTWQEENHVPIHIWQVFYDLAYGIAFEAAENLITDGMIQPTTQVFQAPAGATSKKDIYKIYYHYGYPLSESIEDPTLIADFIDDKNGHILPYVRFSGGQMRMSVEAITLLEKMK